jgi:HAD superfamily hydrolase (TIGR01459 family)
MSADYQVFPNLLAVSGQFEGILLDAYGVFWGGNSVGPLPGAKKAMKQLVESKKIIGILSNSTQPSTKEIEKLRTHGFLENEHFHFFITSGDAAKQVFFQERLPFKTPERKFWLFGRGHPKHTPHTAIFKDTLYTETDQIHEADFIYISIPHINGEDQLHPDIFLDEIKKIKQVVKIPMVCANPDKFAHEGNPPRQVVRQGSIAKMYEELGGEVFYIGKPSSIGYELSMERFVQFGITDISKILMVGDTPETDIRGANNFGIASALILNTGMMADRISVYGIENVIPKLSSTDFPNFFIERLGDI